MDKDRSRTITDKKSSPAARRCKKPDTCIHLRSQRQKQDNTSTQVLYKGPNFQVHRSDEDIFFDCLSISDTDFPREGHSCKNIDSCKPANNEQTKPVCSNRINVTSCKSTCSGQASATSKYDDPEAVRAALRRAENVTQMLLKNFERNQGDSKRQCNATLEITARLLTDPKPNASKCLQGRPVTVQMPLRFDPCSGQMVTCGPSQSVDKSQMSVCSKNASKDYSCPVSTCHVHQPAPVPAPLPIPAPAPAPASAPEPAPAPSPEPKSASSSDMELVPLPLALPTPSSEQKPTTEPVKEPVPVVPITAPRSEPEPAESKTLTPLFEKSPVPSKMEGQLKKYFLALPQHKEFSNCSPCRFDPSPIMDEEGNVFCPGNCGCCQCPWKQRTLDDNRERVNVKVCRCVQRGTIFSNFDERDACSQTSYFDFCPCREKAEAKFLELYDREMWSEPNSTRGREVLLSEIKELKIPPQARQS
ncbi:hypothetical protein AWZ03_011397 [Drosophila navojoa]|uniref:Uncharacterized protein n=1 Tax=Drosophila navojoa TaxID=7232 RepID=A0A484AZY1_DRONA|nr:proteoglycan 4 [Drosophila navojoa]TDG42169.1 hypothetical protein AWZ03_011397 [Drosophila navojoa]